MVKGKVQQRPLCWRSAPKQHVSPGCRDLGGNPGGRAREIKNTDVYSVDEILHRLPPEHKHEHLLLLFLCNDCVYFKKKTFLKSPICVRDWLMNVIIARKLAWEMILFIRLVRTDSLHVDCEKIVRKERWNCKSKIAKWNTYHFLL